jgi:serine/threonine protein kinase
MAAGRLPFVSEAADAVMREILYSEPIMPDRFSPELCDLLSKMLMKDPSNRATWQEILGHPFLSIYPSDDPARGDEGSLHRATIEHLASCGIPETPDIENTPGYRVWHRLFETDCRPGLPGLPPLPPVSAASSAGSALIGKRTASVVGNQMAMKLKVATAAPVRAIARTSQGDKGAATPTLQKVANMRGLRVKSLTMH